MGASGSGDREQGGGAAPLRDCEQVLVHVGSPLAHDTN
jgi:hypothetical protein